MSNHSLPVLFALLVAAAAPCQGLLRVSSFNESGQPLGGPGQEWTTNSVNNAYAVKIQVQQNQDEFTIFFVHVTIDEAVAGSVATRGIIATYPFFMASPNWRGNEPILNSPNFEVESAASTPVGIPPWRVRRHLEAYLADPAPHSTYGMPYNATAPQPAVLTPWVGWSQANLLPLDERKVWSSTSWIATSSGGSAAQVPMLGRAAVSLQVSDYAAYLQLPVAPASIDTLNELLDSNLGFKVLVQAAHVSRPPSGRPKVRFTQINTLRRRSLGQNQPPGSNRWVPAFFDDNINIYLGARGEELQVTFPAPVSNLIAWIMVPVPGSQPPAYDLVPQSQIAWGSGAALGERGLPLPPEVARFPFPVNAENQVVAFTLNGLPVLPVKHHMGGALVSAFDLQ